MRFTPARGFGVRFPDRRDGRPKPCRKKMNGENMYEETTVRTADSILDTDEEHAASDAVRKLATALGVDMSDLCGDVSDDLVTKLQAVIVAMREDWSALNRFLTTTAVNYGWCGDFENRLREYNSHFKVLQLEGRSEYGQRATTYIDSNGRRRIRARDHYGLPEELLDRLASCPHCTGHRGGDEGAIREALVEAQRIRTDARALYHRVQAAWAVARQELPLTVREMAESLGGCTLRDEIVDHSGRRWRLVEPAVEATVSGSRTASHEVAAPAEVIMGIVADFE